MNIENKEPLINCKNLCWQLNSTAILQDINLSLQPNELLGVIGPNGAGKSSLLKMLAKVKQANSGSLELCGKNYASLDSNFFAKHLAYLEQNATVHWPLLVQKVIELGRLPHLGFSQKLTENDQAAIDQAISATGVNKLLGRIFTTLSEGEKMLVNFTRIFASQTQIVLADEPVAALDPNHQLLIMELLQKLIQTKNTSAIVVLHDLNLAARFCDRLILMSEGKIVSSGKIETVLSDDNLKKYYKINADINYSKQTIVPVSRITS